MEFDPPLSFSFIRSGADFGGCTCHVDHGPQITTSDDFAGTGNDPINADQSLSVIGTPNTQLVAVLPGTADSLCVVCCVPLCAPSHRPRDVRQFREFAAMYE